MGRKPPVESASCQMSGLRQHAREQFIPRSNNSRRGHATAPQCGIGPAQPMYGPAAEALPSELPELDGDHDQRPGISAAKGLPRSPPIAFSQPGPYGIPRISNGAGPVRTTPLPMTGQPPAAIPRSSVSISDCAQHGKWKHHEKAARPLHGNDWPRFP